MNSDPRWFPNPEQFDPERLAPGRIEQIPPYAYFPFGGGPRVCIGERFPMVEMTLIIAMLMQHLRVETASAGQQVELLPHMSLRPKGGLRLKWSARTAP
jgi:cytochrome P450